ncbi:hypothetical protein L228DRAFT_247975 [Xylona heveae TC161]|uniref:Uncharacterized protein n=1 Tax=Xylona heveae (strain CBS 132557 / TC161) TaxID=1328760 RepID=A0A165GKR1_XYLHT|nr:hypothetical protein L228DRAFT_247975 [Xylona heveae TC161]KZF22310.1 hypothetical protein L228DRAFT_247975 [Xylona heveae TC161]
MLIGKSDRLKQKCKTLRPKESQWSELVGLSTQLLEAVSQMRQAIVEQRAATTGARQNNIERHWAHVQAFKRNILSTTPSPTTIPTPTPTPTATATTTTPTGKLNSRHLETLRRNMVLIFSGPQRNSPAGSENVLDSRKELTARRCRRIRLLSAHSLITWGLVYSSTTWTAKHMGSTVFNSLLEKVESDRIQEWPPIVSQTLNRLKHNEPLLRACPEYDEFLKGQLLVLPCSSKPATHPPGGHNHF